MTATTTTTTTYAWVITLQKPIHGGMAMVTNNGTIELAPGATRHDLFEQVRREITAHSPELSDANVMFWSLEPNELPLDRL